MTKRRSGFRSWKTSGSVLAATAVVVAITSSIYYEDEEKNVICERVDESPFSMYAKCEMKILRYVYRKEMNSNPSDKTHHTQGKLASGIGKECSRLFGCGAQRGGDKIIQQRRDCSYDRGLGTRLRRVRDPVHVLSSTQRQYRGAVYQGRCIETCGCSQNHSSDAALRLRSKQFQEQISNANRVETHCGHVGNDGCGPCGDDRSSLISDSRFCDVSN